MIGSLSQGKPYGVPAEEVRTPIDVITLGQALAQAAGDKQGMARFGQAAVPMEETLAECALDFCGRPFLEFRVELPKGKVGEFDVELTEADFCCGSAGAYNLLHPEAAREVLARKLDRLAETRAQVVVSGNPGCLLQIEKGLRERGMKMRVVHTVEVLDWSYRGVAPEVA
jgi:hypothetical protein